MFIFLDILLPCFYKFRFGLGETYVTVNIIDNMINKVLIANCYVYGDETCGVKNTGIATGTSLM